MESLKLHKVDGMTWDIFAGWNSAVGLLSIIYALSWIVIVTLTDKIFYRQIINLDLNLAVYTKKTN